MRFRNRLRWLSCRHGCAYFFDWLWRPTQNIIFAKPFDCPPQFQRRMIKISFVGEDHVPEQFGRFQVSQVAFTDALNECAIIDAGRERTAANHRETATANL